MKTLDQLRLEIDDIDEQMTALFVQRMGVSRAIGQLKKKEGLPIQNRAREKEILSIRASRVPSDLRESITSFYEAIFAVSRDFQQKEQERK